MSKRVNYYFRGRKKNNIKIKRILTTVCVGGGGGGGVI